MGVPEGTGNPGPSVNFREPPARPIFVVSGTTCTGEPAISTWSVATVESLTENSIHQSPWKQYWVLNPGSHAHVPSAASLRVKLAGAGAGFTRSVGVHDQSASSNTRIPSLSMLFSVGW